MPGLGILTTALAVLLVGAVATNVVGKRLLQQAEGYLLLVPVFRTIYAPVKQLVVAFSPDNEYGFKRVVLVEDPARGFCSASSPGSSRSTAASGPEPLVAVYVPTNHLYLGDVIVCAAGEGVVSRTSRSSRRSGFSSPAAWRSSSRIRARRGDDRVGEIPRLTSGRPASRAARLVFGSMF